MEIINDYIKKWWRENYQGFSIGWILNLNFGKNKKNTKEKLLDTSCQERLNLSSASNTKPERLDKTEERILMYISESEEVAIGEFAGYMPEISNDELEFYIKKLIKGKYIKRSRTLSRIWLDGNGEKYLRDNNLIKS